jgi:uncharacterized protein involved in outer membrane biogenesis
MPEHRPSRLLRWTLRFLLAGGGLVLAFAVLGFLVAPAVIKAQLPPRASRLLGRQVSVQKVRMNPFALSATVEGLAVRERDGSPFLGWDRLYVSLRWRTLLGREVSFGAIELDHPYGRVTVERGGRMNFSDIVERLAQAGPAPKAAPEPPRTVRIGRLSIQGARVDLQDRSMAEPFATSLGPLSLHLEGFSTTPNNRNPYAFSGRTEAGETFAWTGHFSLEPLASTGTFTVDGLVLPKYHPFYRDQVAFQVVEGVASARAGYVFQWSEGTHVVKLVDGSLDLLRLKLGSGRGAPDVDLPRIEVRGAQADLATRTAQIGSVTLRDGRVSAARAADGTISLVTLLTPKLAPAQKPQPQARPQPQSVPPWRLTLQELRMQGFQAEFRDQAASRPVRILVRNMDLSLRNLSLEPAAQADLELSLELNGKAALKVAGTVAPLRPAADLKVRLAGLELPPFDPYLAPTLAVRLNGGTLAVDGRVQGVFEHKPTDFLAFRGGVRLQRFEAADAERGEPFLGYRSLVLTGLDVRTNPDSVSIQDVELQGSEQRLVVAQDGSTNVGRALKLEAAPPVKTPAAAVGAVLPPSQGPPLKLSIARTRVSGGRLSFVDRSLEPNAALVITGLQGAATSLSTEPDTQSAMDFQGLAGGIAPLRLQGRAMPLRKDQDTDVSFTIQGAELSDFSPYAAKYLGYTIHKGKLAVDAHVVIKQRMLQALLKTRLDQFYLGEKTQSPDAVHVPVKLCLAIMRDRKGVIDLELPVDGSLDDPNLHYGKIVWHAVLNVLTKVATSPFSLLAKLGGGGHDQDLSFVTFEPGSADPDPAAQDKVQSLAKALAERPELSLEAEGSTDPLADDAALRHRALELLLRRTRAGTPDAPDAAQPLPAPERDHWLQVAYTAAFKPAAPSTPPPPPAEMEQRLLGTFAVTPGDLAQLADQRAKVMIRLLREAQVDPARLFEVSAGTNPRDPASRVYFGLKP